MKLIGLAALVFSLLSVIPAMSQTAPNTTAETTNPSPDPLKFTVDRDPETGELLLVPLDGIAQLPPDRLVPPSLEAQKLRDTFVESEALEKGYAVIDPDGGIDAVFYGGSPLSKAELLESLSPGFSVQAVGLFGGKRLSAQEVGDVVLQGIEAAMANACERFPNLGSIKISAEVGVDLGLTTNFKVEVEMRPAEDC